jgi:mRNA-degrading endonuclease toxin of MazEF toxin-antitoxin module
MHQWEIHIVQQQYARKELVPPQPNDPSLYDRMYLVVAEPFGTTAICCPIQNNSSGLGITEVELKKGYTSCITKSSKIICNEIFTLPKRFFEKKVGYLRTLEQTQVQTALIAVLDL